MKRWQIWLENKEKLNNDFKNYKKKELIRKIDSVSHLSKTHLNKAFHNFDFANFTLNNQININKRIKDETYFDWVIVISYYAMCSKIEDFWHTKNCKTIF